MIIGENMEKRTDIQEKLLPSIRISVFVDMMNRLKNILYKKGIDVELYKYFRLKFYDTEYYRILLSLYGDCLYGYMDTTAIRYSTDLGFGVCGHGTGDYKIIYQDNDMKVYECSYCNPRCVVVELSLEKFKELMFKDIVFK